MEIPFTKPQKKFLIGIKYLGSVLINIRLLLSLFLHNCPHHCTKLDEAADSIKMWIILEGGFLTQRLSIEISLRNFYILKHKSNKSLSRSSRLMSLDIWMLCLHNRSEPFLQLHYDFHMWSSDLTEQEDLFKKSREITEALHF